MPTPPACHLFGCATKVMMQPLPTPLACHLFGWAAPGTRRASSPRPGIATALLLKSLRGASAPPGSRALDASRVASVRCYWNRYAGRRPPGSGRGLQTCRRAWVAAAGPPGGAGSVVENMQQYLWGGWRRRARGVGGEGQGGRSKGGQRQERGRRRPCVVGAGDVTCARHEQETARENFHGKRFRGNPQRPRTT